MYVAMMFLLLVSIQLIFFNVLKVLNFTLNEIEEFEEKKNKISNKFFCLNF